MEKRMTRINDFIKTYRLYRRTHHPAYAARIAFGMAFRNLPF
jgi:aminoglycoside N3'-acetyltransferase